jgi:hypothetical protein
MQTLIKAFASFLFSFALANLIGSLSANVGSPQVPIIERSATVNGKSLEEFVITVDLPGFLHRENTTSMGQGCCVWTSIHHAALWHNVEAYKEAPKWIQSKRIPGGANDYLVEKYLPQMAKDRGFKTAPSFVNYVGRDLDILQLAIDTGRMPGITYNYSPTGRYNRARIAHMVNLVEINKKWAVILDNNYISEKAYEWIPTEEFIRVWTAGSSGWAVILLDPPPPAPPYNGTS